MNSVVLEIIQIAIRKRNVVEKKLSRLKQPPEHAIFIHTFICASENGGKIPLPAQVAGFYACINLVICDRFVSITFAFRFLHEFRFLVPMNLLFIIFVTSYLSAGVDYRTKYEIKQWNLASRMSFSNLRNKRRTKLKTKR